MVLSQGRVVYEEGNLHAQQGTGRFIPRKAFPDFAYQRVKFRNEVQNMKMVNLEWSFISFHIFELLLFSKII